MSLQGIGAGRAAAACVIPPCKKAGGAGSPETVQGRSRAGDVFVRVGRATLPRDQQDVLVIGGVVQRPGGLQPEDVRDLMARLQNALAPLCAPLSKATPAAKPRRLSAGVLQALRGQAAWLGSACLYATRQGGRLAGNMAAHAVRNPVSTGMALLALGEHYKQATGALTNPAAVAALHAVRGLGSVVAASGLAPRIDTALAGKVVAGGGVAAVASHPRQAIHAWQRACRGAATGVSAVVTALSVLWTNRIRAMR